MRRHDHEWLTFGLLALALWGLCCTTATPRNVHIQPPPITIVGNPRADQAAYYDAYDLFERGDRAFAAGQWDNARDIYTKLLTEYPAAEIAPMARYNLGLVLENRQQWEEALAVYQAFASPPGHGVRTEEVRMRRGICLMRLQRYGEARTEFESILAQFAVPPLEANEARARLGIAYYRMHDEIMAEHHLRPALETYQQNSARGLLQYRDAFAEGYFVRGEIAFRRFQQITIEGSDSQVADSLHEKIEALIIARGHYENAIRTYVPEWIVAALFRVGQAYELMYDALLAAPEPRDLTPEEQAEYRQKLRAKTRPVLNKALTAYRRNLELAGELNVTGEWVAQTQERYQALLRRE